MRKSSVLLLSSLLVAGRALAATGVPPEALGTARYEVNYQLGRISTRVASATITLDDSAWEQHAAYHSRADIKASSVFRLFMRDGYQADVYLSHTDASPLYFLNPVRKNGADGKFEYVYDAGGGLIRSETVQPKGETVSTTFPLDGRTMDLLALLQYIRLRDFSAGETLRMHLLMGGKSFAATLSCEGTDTERYPDGSVLRFHLKMTERGLMENGSGTDIHVWRSTTSDRRLLTLEVPLSSGAMHVRLVP